MFINNTKITQTRSKVEKKNEQLIISTFRTEASVINKN